MIELNCSYEESKKILELGYDFSKVCWKSQYWYNSDGIAEHIHETGLLLSTIEYRIKSNGCKDAVITGVIPIIPKAALEKCLPIYVDGYDPRNEKIDTGTKIYLRKDTNVYHDFQLMRGRIENHVIVHKEEVLEGSAYKAFIWCHEHYPEELRKKFGEVMG